MVTSKLGIDCIKVFEGCEREAYQDVVGKWTIGYGHLILPSEDYLMHNPISLELAEELLKQDLKSAEECVEKNVKVTLEQHEFDALVSFVYNLGCNAFTRSTLLHLLNSGDKARAAEQFPRWNKAGGKEVRGLSVRREAEKKLFLGEVNAS